MSGSLDEYAKMYDAENAAAGESSSSGLADPVTGAFGTEEFDLPVGNAGIDNMFGSQSLLAHHDAVEQTSKVASGPSHIEMPMSIELQSRREIDSRCCIECCQLIGDLEKLVMSNLKVFRMILQIVRGVIEKLSHMIRLQQSSRNDKCIMLLNTLMYQILEVLEVCLSTATTEREGQRHRALDGGGLFDLGDFMVDEEEQSALRMHTILTETNKAADVLNRLRDLASPTE
ncbi:hypothetical protein LQW54_011364 [Pestalotiopsis sp. IQ-011]